jgi:hypothetical protein
MMLDFVGTGFYSLKLSLLKAEGKTLSRDWPQGGKNG